MALIHEDGTVVANAESYCSVADADAFHKGRGNTAWVDMDKGDKEVALRKATDFMMQAYRGRWLGYRVSESQQLDWPREAVYLDEGMAVEVTAYSLNGESTMRFRVPPNIVPKEVIRACAMLAFKSTVEELSPDVQRETIEETVGPITTKYAVGSQLTRRTAVDNLLSPFLRNVGGVVRKVSR